MSDDPVQIRGPVGPAAGASCALCPFAVNGQPSKPVAGVGPGDRPPLWILVGEGPGEAELRWGQPFVGPTGAVVNRMLEEIRVPRNRIYVTNAASCRPLPGKSGEEYREAAATACRPRLNAELAMFPGRPVLAAGGVASRELLRNATNLKKITDLTGTHHEVDLDGTGPRSVIPTVHPAAMLRGGRGSEKKGKGAGGGHTADVGFWSLKYDALKVHALATGKDIRLRLADVTAFEITDSIRANRLMTEIVAEIRDDKFAAIDLETYVDDEQRNHALQAWAAKIALLGIGSKRRAISLAWRLLTPMSKRLLQAVLGDSTIVKVYQNLAYDTAVLSNRHHRFTVVASWANLPPIEDTMLAHHAAFPGAPHNLQAIGTQFRAIAPWKAEFRDGDETPEEAAQYNANDVIVTAKSLAPLQVIVKKAAVDRVYDLDRKMALLAGKMHLWGYYVDRDVNAEMSRRLSAVVDAQRAHLVNAFDLSRDKVLDRLAFEYARTRRKADPEDIKERITIRRGEIQKEIDKGRWAFSPSNDFHVIALLKTQGVPLLKHTAKGRTSTSAEVLEGVAHHPAVHALLRYRENNKLLAGFVVRMFEWTTDSQGKWRPPFVQDDGRVHPIWSVNKISGRWGSKDPGCFDAETEILTDRGWVHFPDLRDDDRVAQYDGGTAAISFVRPAKVHRYPHAGPMVSWQGTYVDMVVTLNHRVPLLDRKQPDRLLRIVEAGTLRQGCDAAVPTVGWYAGDVAENPAFVRFLVAAQADGSFSGAASWTFALSRPRKIERMRALLSELGILWSESTEGKLRTRVRFTLHADATTRRTRDWLGPRKEFGPWLFTLDGPSLDTFLDELMFWNGSFTRRNTYSSSNRTNADYVQAIATLRGRSARLRAYNSSPAQRKTNWQVDLRPRAYAQTADLKLTHVPYQGHVYCVTVPTGLVVVRRRQVVYISGNSQNWSEGDETNAELARRLPNLRRQVVAPPGRIIVGFDLEQLEARLMALQSGDEFLCRVFAEGLDIHAEFAKILFPQFAQLAPGSPEFVRLRTTTKRFEYGGLYGGADDTVWKSIVVDEPSITLQMVRVAITKMKQAVPGVLRWQQRLLQETSKPPYTMRSYILGRMRVFPLGDPPPTDVNNNPNQFAGADVMNLGMANMLPRLEKYRKRGVETCFPIKQVHDAAYFECDEDDAYNVARDIKASWEQEFTAVNGTVIRFPIELKMGYALHSEPSDKDKAAHPYLVWDVGRPGLSKVKGL